MRRDRDARLDATYELDARWRITGGPRPRTDAPIQSRWRARRLPPDHGRGRRALRAAHGQQPGLSAARGGRQLPSNRSIPSAGFYDNRYSQTDNELRADWAIGRDSQAQFRLGYRNRSHPNYPQRDFAGITGGATLNWNFSPKTALTAGWTRELGSLRDGGLQLLADRPTLGRPGLADRAQTTLRSQLALRRARLPWHARRGRDAAAPRLDPRRQPVADWQPTSYLSLSAALQSARRTSSLAGFDFSSHSINLSAQFTY